MNHIIRFIFQTVLILALRIILFIVGLFIQIPIVMWIKWRMNNEAPKPNAYGELFSYHSDKYISLGSSGAWGFWDAPQWLSWFGNLEDGYLGEPSGKWSASRKGKERSFLSMYIWSAIRNPVNTWSKTHAITACPVEDCDITFKGTEGLNDNNPVTEGWLFLIATSRVTGRHYYSFRVVHQWKSGYFKGKVARVRIGNKVKPSHKGKVMDDDDKLKGWTFRASLATDAST